MTQKQHFYFFTLAFLIIGFCFFILSTPAQAEETVCCVDGDVMNSYADADACDDADPACEGECMTDAECAAEAIRLTSPPATTSTSSSSTSTSVSLPNPLGTDDIRIVIGRIIQILMSAIGSIALMILIYGGFQWLTSMGNPEGIKKGKDIMLWTLLGVIIMFSSYFIVRFIINTLVFGTEVVPPT